MNKDTNFEDYFEGIGEEYGAKFKPTTKPMRFLELEHQFNTKRKANEPKNHNPYVSIVKFILISNFRILCLSSVFKLRLEMRI